LTRKSRHQNRSENFASAVLCDQNAFEKQKPVWFAFPMHVLFAIARLRGLGLGIGNGSGFLRLFENSAGIRT
jgi:hypothetical protein